MDELFGNVNLMGGDDLFEVPIGSETPAVEVEESADGKPKKDTPAEEDDNFIEITVGSKPADTTDEEELSPDGFKEETDEESPQKNKGSSSSSLIKPFAKTLAEEGILPSIDDTEFDKLVEENGGNEVAALMELTRKSILSDIEEYKKTAEADFKEFIEARDAGLDLNQWADIQEAKKFYGAITEDKIDADEDLQKDLIKEHLRLKGIDEEAITDMIESFETTGKLADNAKKSHKNLVKFAEQQEVKLKEDKVKQEETAKKQRDENLKNLRKEVDAMTEIVPGIKINKQTKDKLFTSITTPVKTGANGEQLNAAMAKRAEDPLKYAIIENYLIELGVFDGKWDKIMARTQTKAISELEKALSDKSNTQFTAGKPALGKGGSDDDIDFNLNAFTKK